MNDSPVIVESAIDRAMLSMTQGLMTPMDLCQELLASITQVSKTFSAEVERAAARMGQHYPDAVAPAIALRHLVVSWTRRMAVIKECLTTMTAVSKLANL